MQIAETERLTISKITVDDAPFILELMNTPKWIEFIGDRNVKTEAEARDYLKNNQLKQYENYEFGYYKLCLKDDDLNLIGTAGLLQRDTLPHVDIGFSLLPEFYNQGYGYEASKEIMRLAKDTFQLKTLCAITLPTNQASIQLLKKLGLFYKEVVKPSDTDEELLLFEIEL